MVLAYLVENGLSETTGVLVDTDSGNESVGEI